MTRETILRKALEMAQHNLCCYSANYLNTTPKKGYEKQFEENSKEAEIIETWLKEFPSTYRDVNRVFVGHIGGWSCQRNTISFPSIDTTSVTNGGYIVTK